MMRRTAAAVMVSAASVLALADVCRADRIPNGVAVFAALDKVTARISNLEIPLNETVRFGSLKVTPRVCYSRSATEPPKTSSFIEVDEVQLDGKEKRIFAGWMFAESPGLHAVEHPVFDVWLTRCEQPLRPEAASRDGRGQAQQPQEPPLTRPRPRR
jgi:hypothetical protein